MQDWSSAARAIIIGIAGCRSTGKTALAKRLVSDLRLKGFKTRLIEQDDYYKKEKELRVVKGYLDPKKTFYDYDSPTAIDLSEMSKDLISATRLAEYVVLEGSMLTDIWTVSLPHHTFFLLLDKMKCHQRRMERVYNPPEVDGYFDQVVWPRYERTLNKAKDLKRLTFLDASVRSIEVQEILSKIELLQLYPPGVKSGQEIAK